MRRRSLAAVVALVAGIGAVAAVPAPAQAATTSAIGAISYQARGPESPLAATFADGAGLTVSSATTSAGIAMSGGAGTSHAFSFSIVPPKGDYLRPGTFYQRPTGTDEPDPTAPVVSSQAGRATDFEGRTDVLDLKSDATGRITRFDVVLEGLGEFRMGQTEGTSVSIGMRHMVFGSTATGAPIRMTETLRNHSTVGLALGKRSFSGLSRSSFGFGKSDCPAVLRAGATCRFDVVFDPAGGGPAQATLAMPIGSGTQLVALSGQGMLGTTTLDVTSNAVIHGQTTHSYPARDVLWLPYAFGEGWAFQAQDPYGEQRLADRGAYRADVWVRSGAGDVPLEVGTHETEPFTSQAHGTYGTEVDIESVGPCGNNSSGTENVRSFAVDDRDIPTFADVEFDLTCNGGSNTVKGRLQYQSRSDLTAPARPTKLAISGSTVSWRASTSTDAVATIARLVEGSGRHAGTSSGIPLSAGTATHATLPTLKSGIRYTVAVFSVDKTGNVSAPTLLSRGTAAPVVTIPSAPVIVSASAGDGTATVHFRAPSSTGGSKILYYLLDANGKSVRGSGSPLTVTGLRNGGGVPLNVFAVSAAGSSPQAYAGVVEPIAAVQPTDHRYLPDPGFESGTGGWEAYVHSNVPVPVATLSRTSTSPHSGTGALHVVGSTEAGASVLGIQFPQPGTGMPTSTTYTASCWVRPTAAVGLAAFLSDEGRPIYQTNWQLPAGVWSKVAVAGKNVQGAVPELSFYVTSSSGSPQPVDFDDCSFTSR